MQRLFHEYLCWCYSSVVSLLELFRDRMAIWSRTIGTCGGSNDVGFEWPAKLTTLAATYRYMYHTDKLDIGVGLTHAHPITYFTIPSKIYSRVMSVWLQRCHYTINSVIIHFSAHPLVNNEQGMKTASHKHHNSALVGDCHPKWQLFLISGTHNWLCISSLFITVTN